MPSAFAYETFLERVINDGIAAAKNSYARADQKDKLDGAVAGFEACRNKDPQELKAILSAATIARHEGHPCYPKTSPATYWYYRCYELEVEWVCNVVSAALLNEGKPTIITPTARGVLKAAEIIGVDVSQN